MGAFAYFLFDFKKNFDIQISINVTKMNSLQLTSGQAKCWLIFASKDDKNFVLLVIKQCTSELLMTINDELNWDNSSEWGYHEGTCNMCK